ncbi:hypothetical protein D3C86_1387400 [compost metagenome]
MDGHGDRFPFELQAGVPGHQRLQARQQGADAGRRGRDDPFAASAELRAVNPGSGQTQGLQEVVELGHRPARDDGQRAVQAGMQRTQRANQLGLYLHQVGARREVGQRAVEVQEQRDMGFD